MKNIRVFIIAVFVGTFLMGCSSSPAQLANARGIALAERDDYEGSIIEFTEAINLAPKYALAYFNRGLVYMYLGDYENAVESLTEANWLKPGRYQHDLKIAEGAKTGGRFVVTDIPADYNGKYAYFLAALSNGAPLFGCTSVTLSPTVMTLAKITNGQVSIPMWDSADTSYSGNDTVINNEDIGKFVLLGISNSRSITSFEDLEVAIVFESITFSNGNATKSTNDGTVTTDF